MISSKFSGSPSGSGYPPVCSAPPPPPGTGIPCPYCQNAPKRWTFHPNAIVNNTCSNCPAVNTAFPVDWVAGCIWKHNLPGFLSPNEDFGWTWTLTLGPEGTTLRFGLGLSTEARWTNPALPGPGGTTITVTLDAHNDICCHQWSPTIQLTPAP